MERESYADYTKIENFDTVMDDLKISKNNDSNGKKKEIKY